MSPVIAVVAFVLMEPFTYLAHRFVMHGFGMSWHRSHHRAAPAPGRFEKNDRFPVVFGGATMLAFAVALNVSGAEVLLPICVGVSLYGLVYVMVHDGFIHGRFPMPFGGRLLDRLAADHRLHHRFNGEPYGMLVPVVPKALRQRAVAGDERSPGERIATVPGS